MNLSFLESMRLYELDVVMHEIERIKPGNNILLEIGAGSGWQAKKLSEYGYSVEGIDVETSNYSDQRVWPVQNYDGRKIPFPDEYFDIVFSSNVLEHIPHLHEFQSEIKRVLKPDGIAIHVLPSGSWRFWTTLTHYIALLKSIINIICCNDPGSSDGSAPINASIAKRIERAKHILFPLKNSLVQHRHGEDGNVMTEIYYFSRYRWLRDFKRAGWAIENVSTNKLFYTGYMVVASFISLQIRKYISMILGRSCHIFVLSKDKQYRCR